MGVVPGQARAPGSLPCDGESRCRGAFVGYLAGLLVRARGYARKRAHCLLVLRDTPGALAIARQADALADPSFTSDRTFAMLHLGNAYAQSQEIEEAARVIGTAVGLAAGNSSARVVDSLMRSRRQLDPWTQTAAVRDLDEQLAAHGWTATSTT